MAKLNRVLMRVFGLTATSGQVGKFGSLAAGTPLTTTDPAVAQSLSNWLDGWFAAVVGENAPAIEDMNAVCFVFGYQLGYIFQAGVPEWNTDTVYYTGSMAQSSGQVYVSLTDANSGNAVTDSTKWKYLGNGLTQKSVDYTLDRADEMIEFDATSALRTATLPAASTLKFKKFTITKTDTSVNQVVVTDGTFTKYLLAQYDTVTVYSNGTAWYQVAGNV